ncbi:MAG: hypothetical protein OXE44_12080 [Nitrospinae bacterium]|nr:hypothetical protein [Nitrospinota bacterium]
MPPGKPRDKTTAGKRRKRRTKHAPLDPRTPRRILEEEAFLTKPMLARVLGYKSYRTLDAIIAEDCASDAPCLRPVYLRRPPPRAGVRQPGNHPSFKSARFRREDVLAYVEKMTEDFPLDLEWKFGGMRE